MRVRLVFVPGHKARLDSLRPKSTPIMLAGLLRQEGIHADCLDFGVLNSFRLRTPGADSSESRVHPGWSWFRGRNTDAAVSGGVLSDDVVQAAHFGEEALAGSPGLIAWYVETRDEYSMTQRVSHYVCRHAPQIHQTLIGPYIMKFGASAMSDFLTVNTGVTSNTPGGLSALCENLHVPDCWGRIPGLIYRNGTGIVSSPRNYLQKREVLPASLGVFPEAKGGMRQPGQFALYRVAFLGDGPPRFGFKSAAFRPLHKSVASVLDEMCLLSNRFGAGAFHIEAPHVGGPTLERFADTLLSRNFMTIYSLGGLTEPFNPGLADRLFSSGCRAVGFHTPTGSQRLLEDFYGCDMSISAMRATLRYCRAAGLFTVAHVQYPCPKDDYHTRAETELFLEACRPHGISITAPELTPDSLWFMRASEYGFIINHRSFQQWASCAPGDRGAEPYRMNGWKNGRAEEARRSLEAAAEKLGCVTGITEHHGLLARIVRSAMDETVFVERLKGALESNDIKELDELMHCVNETLDMLQASVAPVGMTAEAL